MTEGVDRLINEEPTKEEATGEAERTSAETESLRGRTVTINGNDYTVEAESEKGYVLRAKDNTPYIWTKQQFDTAVADGRAVVGEAKKPSEEAKMRNESETAPAPQTGAGTMATPEDGKKLYEQATPEDAHYSVNDEAFDERYASSPTEEKKQMRRYVEATADFLNGKLDERGYLEAVDLDKGWIAEITAEEIAQQARMEANAFFAYLKRGVTPETEGSPENVEQPKAEEQKSSATSRIPVSEDGKKLYEQATPEDTFDSLVEELGDESATTSIAERAAKAAQKALDRANEELDKAEEPNEMVEKTKAVRAAQQKIDFWNQVAITEKKRKAEAERRAEEERKAEEPTLKDVISMLYTKGKEYASKVFGMNFFDVAKTPDFMKSLGLTGDKFTIKYGVISRHFGKDGSHKLTEEEWKQLPDALRNPFAISKLDNKENGYRIYTSLQNDKGEYIVVGVDVKNAGRDLEVNAIATVFGRRNDANLPSNEEVIFRSKEITPEQESLLSQPNSDQYPLERELSADKGTESSAQAQNLNEKIADNSNERESRSTENKPKATADYAVDDSVVVDKIGAPKKAVAESIAEALGCNVLWVDGISQNGKIFTDAEGNRTICVSIGSERPLMETFGHETLHRVRELSREAYSELFDAARSLVSPEDFSARIERKRAEYADAGLQGHQLAEEVVGDIIGEHINSEELATDLAMRLKHKTLAALRDIVSKMLETVKRTLGIGAPKSEDEKRLENVKRIIESAYADAVEANKVLRDQTRSALEELGLGWSGGGIMSDIAKKFKYKTGYKTPNERGEFDDAATKYSRRTLPYTIVYYKSLENAREDTAKALEKWSTRMAIQDEVTSLIDKYADKMEGGGKTSLGNSPIRKQEDIYGFTFDVDTSCPRSFANLACVEEAERRLGRPLTLKESVQLNEHLRAYGLEIPCVYCYVENKRQALKDSLHTFMNARNGVYNAQTAEERESVMYGQRKPTAKDPSKLTKAARTRLDSWVQRRESGDTYNPSLPELYKQYNEARSYVLLLLDKLGGEGIISEKKGVDSLANTVVERISQYTDLDAADATFAKGEIKSICEDWIYDKVHKVEHTHFNKDAAYDCDTRNIFRPLSLWNEATKYAKSSSSAKNVSKYMPYTDELRYLKPEQLTALNSIGGLRIHSNNDFRIDYVEDYFQVLAHMSAIGLMGQVYTKNPDFVKIFGGTGLRINMSIAAYGGENGKPVIMNEQEGFNWEVARQLREKYPDAGVMMMVTNDAQLEFALNCPWIDMIIPFHASGLPRAVWYDMRKWQNYTATQNEKLFSSSDKVNALKSKGIDYARETKGMSKGEAAKWIEETFDNTFHTKHVYEIKDGKKVLANPHFEPGEKVIENETGRYVIPGHHNDRETYLRLCEEYGVKPRFAGVKVHDADGNLIDVTEHPNYIKLIKETARAEMEQHPVEFNIDKADERMPLITEENAPIIFGEEYDKAEVGKHMSPMQYAMTQLADFAKRGGYTNVQDYKSLTESTGYGDIIGDFIENVVKQNRPINYITDDARLMASITNKALTEAYDGRMPYEGNGETDVRESRAQSQQSNAPVTHAERVLRDEVIDRIKASGVGIFADAEFGQELLDRENGKDVARLQKVYHGGGADFDHFDHSHMGEGEGKQVFGWGTYLTEVEGIGRYYAIKNSEKNDEAYGNALSEYEFASDNIMFASGEYKRIARKVKKLEDDLNSSLSRIAEAEASNNTDLVEELKARTTETKSALLTAQDSLRQKQIEIAEAKAKADEAKKVLDSVPKPARHLYTVEIPDDNGSNYIDWREEVSSELLDLITEGLRNKFGDEFVENEWISLPAISSREINGKPLKVSGLYRRLTQTLGSDKASSEFLSDLGYTGINPSLTP